MAETPPPLSRAQIDAGLRQMGLAGQTGIVPVDREQGGSMRPTLRPGDVMKVEFFGEPPDRSRLRLGDLLLFRFPEAKDSSLKPVVHRLVGCKRRAGRVMHLRLRGDGSPRLDPPVQPGDVLGRVVAIGVARATEDQHDWFALTGIAAKLYARAVGAHNLFWSALGSTMIVSWRFRRTVERVDRLLLRFAHGVLFRACHPKVTPPPSVCDGGPDGG